MDENKEDACELASGTVPRGCDIFCFYGQYKFLNERLFPYSCFVEDSYIFIVLAFQLFLGVAGSRYRDAEVSWTEFMKEMRVSEKGISGRDEY